jgi:response regulator of citrate/malate metabolism
LDLYGRKHLQSVMLKSQPGTTEIFMDNAERKIANLWIIDDDPMASFYIKRLAELGELASIITIYDKAQWAIDYLLHHKKSTQHLPDLILLDIYMPEMDGWDFLKKYAEIREQMAKRIDIYLISSSNHARDVQKANSFEDVKAYLQKPVTKEQLRAIINK